MDSTGQITDDQANPDANSIGAPHEGEIFDPDTLANLAALSRMEHNEGSDEDADGEDVVDGGQEYFSALFTGRVTREQVQDFVNGLGASDRGTDEDKAEGEEEKEDGREERDGTEDVQSDENESDGDDEGRSESEDGENLDPKYVFEGGKLKRRRNRTTLWVNALRLLSPVLTWKLSNRSCTGTYLRPKLFLWPHADVQSSLKRVS